MQIVGIADIDGNCHSCVGNSFIGLALGFAQGHPVFFCFGIIGKLHEEKRKLTLSPALAPVLNHQRERRGVFIRTPRVTIRLTLIPDCASHAVGNQWLDHSPKEHGCMVRIAVWLQRTSRNRRGLRPRRWLLLESSGFGDRLVPCCQCPAMRLVSGSEFRLPRGQLRPVIGHGFRHSVTRLTEHVEPFPGFRAPTTSGRKSLQRFRTHPGLHRRTTDVGTNQSDGAVLRLL